MTDRLEPPGRNRLSRRAAVWTAAAALDASLRAEIDKIRGSDR
jgi:hypothetical protein